MQRLVLARDSAENCGGLQLALINKVDDVPVVHVVVWVSRTVKVPQIQFIALTEDIPVASRSSTSLSWRRLSFPWSWTPLRFSSCSTLTRWSTFVVQVLQFSGADVEETVELPQLQLVELRIGCCMPVVCNDRCRVVRSAENCVCPAVAALWLGESFFKGPVHKYTAGGRVHRDTAPIIRCTVRSYRQRFVRSTQVRTTTTTTTTTTRKAGPLVSCRWAQ